MATTLFSSFSCPSSRTQEKSYMLHASSLCRLPRSPFGQRLKFSGKRLNFCVKAEEKNESPSSYVAVEEPKEEGADNDKKDVNIEDGFVGNANNEDESAGSEENEKGKLQEVDWKQDEAFKNFMGNPSLEAAIKLEKRRAERKLQVLNRERSGNPFVSFFNNLVRANLSKEKERLEKAEESFKALDLGKLKSCFGFDTFFATDVRRFGDGGIFIGNLRKPIEEAIPKLEKKLSEAAGREVVVWLMEEKTNDITKQACVVQPKSEIDLQFESTKLSTPWGYISSITLAVTTFGTVALTSGLFLKPDATIDDYLANFVPLFG